MNFRLALNITGILFLAGNFACKKEETYADSLVYGHAGTTIYPERWVYPANTAESVIYALDVLDAEGVEVDVQMTKDSVLVLYHDAYLDENTHLTGCIPNYNLSQLSNLDLYHSRYEIATLDEVLQICTERHKKLFLDLKPYHYCDSVDIDFAVFNRALNKSMAAFSAAERSDIVVNSRTADLLMALTDSSIVRSFETENIGLGIEIFESGAARELCISLTAMNAGVVQTLQGAGINYSVFGVKTREEIERALTFAPLRIITDNVAYTQKLTR
ncbi:MAG: hypothetical protein HYZ14_08810 [Bacteroidetes bacterium]|nr:hypothetical protein [Bacteroidota bacterium]